MEFIVDFNEGRPSKMFIGLRYKFIGFWISLASNVSDFYRIVFTAISARINEPNNEKIMKLLWINIDVLLRKR